MNAPHEAARDLRGGLPAGGTRGRRAGGGGPGPGRAAVLAAALVAAASQARDFRAEGSDAGSGVGARYVALGGTGVALADDLYAAIHNPAGLARLDGLQLSVSRQLDARLQPVNAAGAAWKLPLRADGPQVGLAAVFYPRMHARASGAFSDADFESVFLRYLLPGISGTFDGDIDSKTRAWRLAAGFAPWAGSDWSFGAYIERVDCRSDFCGVHASSNGYTESSTRAKATALGIGVRHRFGSGWAMAASANDLNTRLNVSTVTTDSLGTRERLWDARFPRKLAVELARDQTSALRWAVQLEATRGRYGRSELDIRVLRAGIEKDAGAWRYRAGAIVPLKIASSETRELKAPVPLAPTVGLGWRRGPLELGLAVHAQPVMSMHKDRPVPTADLSLLLRL